MRNSLHTTLLVGLAGVLSLATACGDDTTATTSGGLGGSGGSGDGGSDATTASQAGSTSTVTTGQSTATATSSSGSSTSSQSSTSSGEGGNPSGGGEGGIGQGGNPSGGGEGGFGQGGNPSGGGEGGIGQGGNPGTGGEGGIGTTVVSSSSGGSGCTAITLDQLSFFGNGQDGAAVYGSDVSPQIDGADNDLVGALFYDDTLGTFDLSDEGDLATCLHCVIANIDVPDGGDPAKFFYAQSGSLALTGADDLSAGIGAFSLSDVRLAEATVDQNGAVTFVPNGDCLELDTASYSFAIPAEWICPDSYYTDLDCDCGCGAQDPVCTTTNTVAECEYCSECRDDFVTFQCAGFVDPADTTQCDIAGTTASSSSGGAGCDPTEFECNNGECLPFASWECDDFADCADESDEAPINPNCVVGACEPDEFTCDNGECIPDFWECDDFTDCADDSDEAPINPNCGGGGSDCCVANGGLGCDDNTCETTVCGIDDFCCDTEWDSFCADIAADECAICQ